MLEYTDGGKDGIMNHQIYLDWLFEDAQDLTAQQSQALQNHLTGCEQCRALTASLKSLESSFSQAEVASPLPGFASRWQTRLSTNREAIHRRQIITIFSILVSLLALFLVLMVVFLWPWLRSPSLLFYTWIYQLFSLYTYADTLRDLAFPIFGASYSAIPWITLIFGLGFFSELVVLWIVSYRLLTNPRRVIL
jgi:hypothetical protein